MERILDRLSTIFSIAAIISLLIAVILCYADRADYGSYLLALAFLSMLLSVICFAISARD